MVFISIGKAQWPIWYLGVFDLANIFRYIECILLLIVMVLNLLWDRLLLHL
jgi:hypothetical protein